MKHGEVWQLGKYKALVISTDVLNTLPGAAPIVVPLIRYDGPDAGPFTVRAVNTDPVAGVILLPQVAKATEVPGDATVVGYLSGATMAKVTAGLSDLFGY